MRDLQLNVLTTPRWYILTFYLFPFQVRLIILFTSLYYRIRPSREGSDKDPARAHWILID